jgi:carbonic anhydrase/acetyltransferase-like protein (isoleucine patch superfamily)
MKPGNIVETITSRVSEALKPLGVTGINPQDLVPGLDALAGLGAAYAVTATHPHGLSLRESAVGGSYLLGRVRVEGSVLAGSDVRGDELKSPDKAGGEPETVSIRNCLLYRTCVHNHSHDPDSPGEFGMRDTVALDYANIHGAPVSGSLLEPWATIDLTTVENCRIGAFAYVQTGKLSGQDVAPGTVLIDTPDFSFTYVHPAEALALYVSMGHEGPRGLFVDWARTRAGELDRRLDTGGAVYGLAGQSSSVNPLAVVTGEGSIGENVLVAQRAWLEDAVMGKGANAQENCILVKVLYEGNNVTAHGGRVMETELGQGTFVGFNSFLRGPGGRGLKLGQNCVVAPHTVIDVDEPLEIPPGSLVWGMIRSRADLEEHMIALQELAEFEGELTRGAMTFKGSGRAFVEGFGARIHHILEENGAFHPEGPGPGHAQTQDKIAVNLLRPFPSGQNQGLYPDWDLG